MDFVSYTITDPTQFWAFPQQRKSENYTSDTSAHKLHGWLSFIPLWQKKCPSVIWKITLILGLSIRPSKLYPDYVTGRFTDQIEMSNSHGLFNLEHNVQPTGEEIQEVNLYTKIFGYSVFTYSISFCVHKSLQWWKRTRVEISLGSPTDGRHQGPTQTWSSLITYL